MDDPHQVNTMMAAAICDFFKGRTNVKIGTEEAKILAKQIVEALNGAGLQVVAIDHTAHELS